MSLEVIIGRAGTGKTTELLGRIQQDLMNDPTGPPIWVIVPDQMTFNIEQAINRLPGIEGMTRLNVFSFSRLALRVLENVGGAARTHLSQAGIAMLIRKAVEEGRESLRVFKKAADQHGFYDVLQRTFSEFKRYGVTEEVLADKQTELSQTSSSYPLLVDKLHDLLNIYSSLNQKLKGKYVDSDDYLTFAAEKLPEWGPLSDATIYLDGFDSFTPQEWVFLKPIFQHSEQLVVTLTADPDGMNATHQTSNLSIFKRAKETYERLVNFTKEWNVRIDKVTYLTEPLRFKSPMLQHLEKAFDKRPYPMSHEWDGAVSIIEAANRRTEVEEIARHIQTEVIEHNRRYREIAILVRDLPTYRDLIETIFTDYNIPFFSDQKRTMHHHPLIELIRSSLETLVQNWRYEPVFRALKTDLLFPTGEHKEIMREQVDQLENYCVAYGIGGKHWKSKAPWRYFSSRGLEDAPEKSLKDAQFERELNGWRHTFSDPLLTFERNLRKAKTVEEKCAELYWFLEGLGVPEKIEQLRNQAELEGRLSEAREHDQAWQAVLDLLDQLVEAAGEDQVSLDLFAKLLESGLDQLRFSLVPPALDQVIVGGLDRSRVEGTDLIYILGVNEGVLPAKPMEDGLLSDEERSVLEAQAVQLAPSARAQLFDEEALIYRAFTSPSQALVLSYPIASEEGQSLMPSLLIRRMGHFFSGLTPEFRTGEPHEATSPISFVSPSSRTLSFLSQAIRRWHSGYPIHESWWEVYNAFLANSVRKSQVVNVLSSHFYRNEEPRLKPETAVALYGHDLQGSVSRMERFNSCPFSQFATYGLRLKERDMFRLEAPDIGQLFHSALKWMTDEIQAEKKDWAMLSQEECLNLARRTVDELAPKLQREILLSSARYHYLKRKLEEIVGRAAVVLSKQAVASGFSPVGLELPFGPGAPLPPLTFKLPNGGTMRLVGRIDRVDRGITSEGVYLRIIDYKSGDKALDLQEVYYGLSLQMLAYLDVILTYSQEWLGEHAEPAGVLYFHLHNPILSEDRRPNPDDLEEVLLKEFRMRGLLLEEDDVLDLMDSQVEHGTSSSIVPFGRKKKDGSLTKTSTVANRESFEKLRAYTRHVFEQVGGEIISGSIEISPYKLKNKMPCGYCAFKPVCHFDPAQPGDAARVLEEESDRTPLERIFERLSEAKEV